MVNLSKWGIDGVVLVTLANRFFLAISGLVNAGLVTHYFTPELQGFYYTCTSLVMVQTLFELGFGQVATHYFSHESGKVNFRPGQPVTGQAPALIELARLVRLVIWYSLGAGLAFFLVMAPLGLAMLSRHGGLIHNLVIPWLGLALGSAVILALSIWRSALDGMQCFALGQRASLVGVLSAAGIAWPVVILGGGLFALMASSLIQAIVQAIMLRSGILSLTSMLIHQEDRRIHFPPGFISQQWRLAVSWLCGYLSFQSFVPILFFFQGPVLAGQMGLTLQIYHAVNFFSTVWFHPKAPQLGEFAAARDFTRLRARVKQFQRVNVVSGVGMILAVGLIVAVISRQEALLASRLFSPDHLLIFLLASLPMLYSSPQSTALRFMKIEPYMMLSILQALLVTGVTVFSSWQGSISLLCWGYAATSLLVGVFLSERLYQNKLQEISEG
jgi:hypothetical protein